jgi:hypothetical protein
MKRYAKRFGPQMKLTLFNTSPATMVPEGKQEELTLALMELLIHAAEANAKLETQGGKDECETHA